MLDDISELQENAASNESEIASLGTQIDRECAKTLQLKHKVRCLEKDLERRKGDVEKQRADATRQCDHYNKL